MSLLLNLLAAGAAPIESPTILQQTLVAADAGSNDKFGDTVAFSSDGHTMAVGAWGGGFHDGAVYIYVRSGTPAQYTAQAKLTMPGISGFGYTLSLSDDGNTLAVGHTAVTNGVYVFVRSGPSWSLQATITPSVTGGRFGQSLQLAGSGDRLVVGAPGQTSGSTATGGAIFIFNRAGVTWTQAARLLRTTPVVDEQIGSVVAISGDGNYAIALCRSGTPSLMYGFVFFFNGSTWGQQAALSAPATPTNLHAATDSTGTYLFIADQNFTATVPNQGVVLVYKRSGVSWAPQSSVVLADFIGGRVTCSADAALVACTFQPPAAEASRWGSAVLLRGISEVWRRIAAPIAQTLFPSVPAVGYRPALCGDGKTMAIGAPEDRSVAGLTTGVVRVYTTTDRL